MAAHHRFLIVQSASQSRHGLDVLNVPEGDGDVAEKAAALGAENRTAEKAPPKLLLGER